MKRSRFSEEQIIGILKEHQAGMSAPTSMPSAGTSWRAFYPRIRKVLPGCWGNWSTSSICCLKRSTTRTERSVGRCAPSSTIGVSQTLPPFWQRMRWPQGLTNTVKLSGDDGRETIIDRSHWLLLHDFYTQHEGHNQASS